MAFVVTDTFTPLTLVYVADMRPRAGTSALKVLKPNRGSKTGAVPTEMLTASISFQPGTAAEFNSMRTLLTGNVVRGKVTVKMRDVVPAACAVPDHANCHVNVPAG